MGNKNKISKYFKIGGIICLGYILFSCSQWIVVRVQSEKQLKEVCRKIEKNMSKSDLVDLVLSYPDFKMYQSDKDSMMFYTKKSLPEMPICRMSLKNAKVEKVDFVDYRN
ncbi:hypothetical protein QSV37_13485 [Acinetobacter sp. VNK23]|uniref:hypothetical protein n=1 Tax=Acinetobacter thutiue TaxID=2998078 RepID=UPI0025755510|nr:hypothetical protein [Acinetobacter thutiue]MDM1021307.1 hypothetical protein [Acinetobacter thutiue]